jgi:hypothetical protein
VDQVLNSDPVQLFELLAVKVDKSGVAVAQLGDLLGDRLGGKTLEFIKSIASDGIPKITSETAAAIDEVSELMDKWASLKEEIKLITVKFVLDFEEKRQQIVDKMSDYLAKFIVGAGSLNPAGTKAMRDEIDVMAKERESQKSQRQNEKESELLKREEKNEERKKQTTDALKQISQQTKREEIQKEIDNLRNQRQGAGSSGGGSFAQDSLRSIGGLVGRDLPSLPIIERTARATEQLLAVNMRIEDLQRQLVETMPSGDWSQQ